MLALFVLILVLLGCDFIKDTKVKGFKDASNGFAIDFVLDGENCNYISPFIRREDLQIFGLPTKDGRYFFDVKGLEGLFSIGVDEGYYLNGNIELLQRDGLTHFKGRSSYVIRRKRVPEKNLKLKCSRGDLTLTLLNSKNIVRNFSCREDFYEIPLGIEDVGKSLIDIKEYNTFIGQIPLDLFLLKNRLQISSEGIMIDDELNFEIKYPGEFTDGNIQIDMLKKQLEEEFYDIDIQLEGIQDLEIKKDNDKKSIYKLHFLDPQFMENIPVMLKIKIGNFLFTKELFFHHQFSREDIHKIGVTCDLTFMEIIFGEDVEKMGVDLFYNNVTLPYFLSPQKLMFILGPKELNIGGAVRLQVIGHIYEVPTSELGNFCRLNIWDLKPLPIFSIKNKKGGLYRLEVGNCKLKELVLMSSYGEDLVILDHLVDFYKRGASPLHIPTSIVEAEGSLYGHAKFTLGVEDMETTFLISSLKDEYFRRLESSHFVESIGVEMEMGGLKTLDGTVFIVGLDDQSIIQIFEKACRIVKGLKEVKITLQFGTDSLNFHSVKGAVIDCCGKSLGNIRPGENIKRGVPYSFNILDMNLGDKLLKLGGLDKIVVKLSLKLTIEMANNFSPLKIRYNFPTSPLSIKSMGRYVESFELPLTTLRPIISSQTFLLQMSYSASTNSSFLEPDEFYETFLKDKSGNKKLLLGEESMDKGFGQNFYQEVEMDKENFSFMKNASWGSVVASLLDLGGGKLTYPTNLSQGLNVSLFIFGVFGIVKSLFFPDSCGTKDSRHWGESLGFQKGSGTLSDQYDYANLWEMFVYISKDMEIKKSDDFKKIFPNSSINTTYCAKIRVIRKLESLDGKLLCRSTETCDNTVSKRNNNNKANVVKFGWHKFILRIDKIGLASSSKSNGGGWSIVVPQTFRVFRHTNNVISRRSLSSKKYHPDMDYLPAREVSLL